MAKEDTDKLFDEADVLIIAGLALGMTQEAAGNFVCTPTFTAGVSERTVRNRMGANRDAYDRLIARIATQFRKQKEDYEAITKAEYRKKLETLRSKGFRVKELALDQAILNYSDTESLKLGVNVADGLEDRDFGKAKQVVDHSGEVKHDHFVWTSETPRQLMAQERDMIESESLLKALPGEVLEAEVIADA